MVFDSIKSSDAYRRFYTRTDCETFRRRRIIPARVRVWIGRCSLSTLHLSGTDVAVQDANQSKVGIGTVSTVIVGHLAVQVFAMRVSTDSNIHNVQPKAGDWDRTLVQLWPITKESVTWPPAETFTTSGPNSIATLINRWKVGKKVPHRCRVDCRSGLGTVKKWS